jgi:hypothetical protein
MFLFFFIHSLPQLGYNEIVHERHMPKKISQYSCLLIIDQNTGNIDGGKGKRE